MEINLLVPEKRDLELHHKKERDKRVADRIKAVLLKSEEWTDKNIAVALRIHEETVRTHLDDWRREKKLQGESGGSTGKLNHEMSRLLEKELEKNTYVKVSDICAYVYKTFSIGYTVSGMTKWLKEHNFSYKKPKLMPAKANLQQQENFVQIYFDLLENTQGKEPIFFMDSAHPTMATKVSCGWIKKGRDKLIAQTASRTRVNVTGAIDLQKMEVLTTLPEKVNGETTIEFFQKLKDACREADKIHIILDQSGYHRSNEVQDFARNSGIELHYLPAYSPNLNPIERLWKVMNEEARNNIVFSSAKEFREAIVEFFEIKLPKMLPSLRQRINDNFEMPSYAF